MGLQEYRRKRNFKNTPEPTVRGERVNRKPIFVVQEHWASHLHYDFRLEAFGTLKSWAVPKGPPAEVGEKRLAIQVEDHPISYAQFHGRIPKGEYGAGRVKIWDRGHWIPPEHVKADLKKGHLEFELKGRKLKGRWLLQRMGSEPKKKHQWLLIKRPEAEPSTAKSPARERSDPWPEAIAPQLAQLKSSVPEGPQWIHEIKLDGYRTLVELRKGKVRFLTRHGLDWSHRYQALEKAFKKLKARTAILDGEIVALDESGRSSFVELHAALKGQPERLLFYAFDLLYLDGSDLRAKPLEQRKLLLKQLLQSTRTRSKSILYSQHIQTNGNTLFKKVCQDGLEGIVSKNRSLPYTSGRSDAWQKIKCSLKQELVIGGYTDPQGTRNGLGALLMGSFENGNLRYVGRVGTGFSETALEDLGQKLKKLATRSSPFVIASPQEDAQTHWVKPKLIAEIEFKTWTKDRILRHASFQGLREDKSPTEVHLETPEPKTTPLPKKSLRTGFRITHPERMIYSSVGITKLDVARYYKSVAPWLLRYLSGRPLALVRCPKGATQDCFFQKHIDRFQMRAVNETLIKDQKVIFIDSEEGLLELVQWGVLEFHTWQTHVDHGLHPDQIVFDLDPDAAVTWETVLDTCWRLKELLEKLGLKSFVKTTGGNGLHIQVPIAPRYSWVQIKAFAKTVTQQLESENPSLYTTLVSKKRRNGKIFLDYLRNGFGATAITPYSLRAKERATVSVPVTWTELDTLKSGADFELSMALERLALQKSNPWPRYAALKQKIGILDGGAVPPEQKRLR